MQDYYVVLGIPRDESAAGVRAAFRDLAKRHHPDRAGPAGTVRFLEISDAYRVLGDEVARQAYDESLRRRERGGISEQVHRRRRRRPAPGPFTDEPLDVFGKPGQPSAEALLARLLSNFTTRGRPKAERSEPLVCHVLLSADEAERGGILPVRIPVLERCSSCGGSGHVWPFPCIDCGAAGTVQRTAIVEVRIPPGVPSGSRFTVSLDRVGVVNLFLEVLVRVAARR